MKIEFCLILTCLNVETTFSVVLDSVNPQKFTITSFWTRWNKKNNLSWCWLVSTGKPLVMLLLNRLTPKSHYNLMLDSFEHDFGLVWPLKPTITSFWTPWIMKIEFSLILTCLNIETTFSIILDLLNP